MSSSSRCLLKKLSHVALVPVVMFSLGTARAENSSEFTRELLEYAEGFKDDVAEIMDYQSGEGTGELPRFLSKKIEDFQKRAKEAYEAEDPNLQITFRQLRKFVRAVTNNKGFEVPVVNHKEAIEEGNLRLRRSGIDFITIIPRDESSVLPGVKEPLPQHQQKYNWWMGGRKSAAVTVALVSGAVGGIGPGLAVGGAAAVMEYLFATYSKELGPFWEKQGLIGNMAVNFGVGVLLSIVRAVADLAVLGAPTESLTDFFVKTVVISTLMSTLSVGGSQVDAARLAVKGQASELKRAILENIGVLWNTSGRVAALAAAHVGGTFEIDTGIGLTFYSGEFLGWGMQAAFFAVITAPMMIKTKFGEAILDRYTSYQLRGIHKPANPWNKGVQ